MQPLMPVQLSRQAFGPYSLVTIGSDDSYVSFVPERSAYVHQVCLAGRELLWNYADGDALTRNHGHRNIALLPFPNRMAKGTYEWLGDTHHFAINDRGTGSALHGFNHDAPFELASVMLGEHRASALLRYLHTAERHPTGYPFLVLFEVEVSIDTQVQQMSWRMSARNLDQTVVPVGIGWHPYFRTDGGIKGWTVAMPPNEQVELVDALPTGQLLPGVGQPDRSKTPVAVEVDASWDSCFALSEIENRTVLLSGPNYRLKLEQGDEAAYTQLFVPPSLDCVAIEPVTIGVDAFRQNSDEVALAPGKTSNVSMLLRLV